MVAGFRYLGDFLGDEEGERAWLGIKAEDWASAVEALTRTAYSHPQVAYLVMQMSLQEKWQFVQRVTKETMADLAPIEAALKQKFLSAFFGEGEVTAELHELTQLPLKASRMVFPDLTSMAPQAYATSFYAVQNLTAALMGDTVFYANQQAVEAKQARSHAHKTAMATALLESDTLITPLTLKVMQNLLRAQETGVWLSYATMVIGGNELSAVKWRY